MGSDRFHLRCEHDLVARLAAAGYAAEGRVERSDEGDAFVHWHIRGRNLALWFTHDGTVTINRSAGDVVLELEAYKMDEVVLREDVWRRLSAMLQRGE